MKRALILPFILLILCLFGCTRTEYGILSYQDKDIEAQCIINEKYKARITKSDDSYTLSIIEPSELATVKFEIYKSEAYAVAGYVKVPIEKKSLSGICALFNMFSLDEASLTTATEIENGAELEFSNDYGSYKIVTSKNGTPKSCHISGNGYEYMVEIESILLK